MKEPDSYVERIAKVIWEEYQWRLKFQRIALGCLAFLFLFIGVLCLIFVYGAYAIVFVGPDDSPPPVSYKTPQPPIFVWPTQTKVKRPTPKISSTPVSAPTSMVVNTTKWELKTFDLYDQEHYANGQIKIPSDWEFHILQRYSAPVYVSGPKWCIDYEITDPTEKIKVRLAPLCGPGDSNPGTCQRDTVLVSKKAKIIRYFDSGSRYYRYAFGDGKNCYEMFHLSNQQNFVLLSVDLAYFGTVSNRDIALSIVDSIVQTLEIK